MQELSLEEGEVQIVALQDIPAFEVAGEVVGPLERGEESKLRYWVARLLVQHGLVKIQSKIDLRKLHELYWRELLQPGKKLFPLPRGFFAALKRYLNELEEGDELSRAKQLAADIVNCRIRKIVALATLRKPTKMLIQPMAEEEIKLHRALKEAIDHFKSAVLGEQP